MAKAKNKTQPTSVAPEDYLATVEPARRREEGLELLAFFDRVTGLQARMWGPSIIGYGRYHYKYETGREGDMLLTGFSPRKAALTLYVMSGYRESGAKFEQLGKHKTGKSCLYINKLSDVNLDVLETIVREDLAYMRANYDVFDE